jgi:hypothetical protein
MALFDEDDDQPSTKMEFWAHDFQPKMKEGRLRFHDFSQPDGHSSGAVTSIFIGR